MPAISQSLCKNPEEHGHFYSLDLVCAGQDDDWSWSKGLICYGEPIGLQCCLSFLGVWWEALV